MIQRRSSKQRSAILENLRGRVDHPSADGVYLAVREAIPSISLGTVYRNLNELAECGEILRFTAGGKERFDGNTTPHYHFVCRGCGNVYDVFDGSVSDIGEHAIQSLSCSVEDIRVVVYGRCNACCDIKNTN